MTTSLNSLAESLTDEFSKSAQQEYAEATQKLEEIISRVPEKTEFTDSPFWAYFMPVALALFIAMLYLMLKNGMKPYSGGAIFLLVMILATIKMSYDIYTGKKEVFMTLDRRKLTLSNVSDAIDLTNIERISIAYDIRLKTIFFMKPSAELPQFVRNYRFNARKPIAFIIRTNRKKPAVHIMSVGISANGKKISGKDYLQLLSAYVDAAVALQQLDALRNKYAAVA